MNNQLVIADMVFALSDGTAYDELQRESDGGWTSVDRFGQKPIRQKSGPGLETMTINAQWHKGPGLENVRRLRALQAMDEPHLLTDAYGYNLGYWTINKVREKHTRVIDDGTPMSIDVTVDLEEYVE